MTELVLASRSPIRLAMLERAGLTCRAIGSGIDEAPIKARCREDAVATEDAALALARAKAQDVAPGVAEAIVVGADQILDVGGVWLGKPSDHEEAAAQLRQLSGRSHRLVTAVCMVRHGDDVWNHCDVATLQMTPLDERSIADYLVAIGETACESVGAYQIEGYGIRLFDHIEGDFFSILGLPLVPLLGALRLHGETIP